MKNLKKWNWRFQISILLVQALRWVGDGGVGVRRGFGSHILGYWLVSTHSCWSSASHTYTEMSTGLLRILMSSASRVYSFIIALSHTLVDHRTLAHTSWVLDRVTNRVRKNESKIGKNHEMKGNGEDRHLKQTYQGSASNSFDQTLQIFKTVFFWMLWCSSRDLWPQAHLV